jgi:conjugative transfer signal peptidase TraF
MKACVLALAISITALAGALLVGFLTAQVGGITINATSSMPGGLYLREPRGTLRRGDIVMGCMPLWAVEFRRENGLAIPSGPCPGNAETVLKRVAAIPGDHVTVRRHGVLINGQLWLGTQQQMISSNGVPLPHPFVDKSFVVAAGQVWLLTHSATSFDSRYWGPTNLVLFSARPLLTFTKEER